MKPAIMLVDDEESIRFGFSRYLSRAGYNVKEADSLSAGQKLLLLQRFDAILLDLNLPDGNSIEWIRELRENYPDLSIVVITGYGDVPTAVEAMRRGADNFLTKPVNMEDLDLFLKKSLELGTLRRTHLTSQRLAKKDRSYFGESPAVKKVQELALLAAQNASPVILLGETGSGKGVLARWIHDNGSFSSAPFVELNCSNLRGELLASELFGHARGAFTTAVQDRQGLIEVADGGTLFLDEISDMDMAVQAQFLKVIEEKQYRRLGEVKMRRSEFRLICASNRDLLEETKQGNFRRDLYFRINVFPIFIPPLRERPEDIPGLVHHLLAVLGAPDMEISRDVMQLLEQYHWPGNIRELRNLLERALILSRGSQLTPDHFAGLEYAPVAVEETADTSDLTKVEEAHIKIVMQRFGNDTKKAAEALGISRATLYRKLKKLKE
ncbi:MAG: sigma-54 dependent transcriptional regulator [Nitrospirota bacterium]